MSFRSLFSRKNKKLGGSPNASMNMRESSPAMSRSNTAVLRNRHAEELEQVFKRFDVNGDGKISSSELGTIMGGLGHTATEDELQKMIKEVDKDGDGYIDLSEFIELNTKGVDSTEALQNLKDAFAVYDIDGNGSISADELQKVMRSLGDEHSLAECRRMISGVDHDGDGTISFEEFKSMMTAGCSRFDAVGSQGII